MKICRLSPVLLPASAAAFLTALSPTPFITESWWIQTGNWVTSAWPCFDSRGKSSRLSFAQQYWLLWNWEAYWMVLKPSSPPLEAPLAETFTNNLLRLIPNLNHHWIISGTLETTWLEAAPRCTDLSPFLPFRSSGSLHRIWFSPQQYTGSRAATKCIKRCSCSNLNWRHWPVSANACFGPCTSSRFIGGHGPRFVDETNGYITCKWRYAAETNGQDPIS